MNLITKFAEAIKTHEGWFAGSRSQRNHNPGNLKFANQEKAIGKDNDNFAIFAKDEDGYEALMHQIIIAIDGRSKVYNPEMTILQFFERYAPSADNNNPHAYAKFVADYIGASINCQIKYLKDEIENEKKQLLELSLDGKIIFKQEI